MYRSIGVGSKTRPTLIINRQFYTATGGRGNVVEEAVGLTVLDGFRIGCGLGQFAETHLEPQTGLRRRGRRGGWLV